MSLPGHEEGIELCAQNWAVKNNSETSFPQFAEFKNPPCRDNFLWIKSTNLRFSFSGCLVMGIGSITFSFPHFLMGPYDLGDGDGNSTSSNICSRYYKGHQNFWSYSNSRNQILMLFVMTVIWTLKFLIFLQERFSHSIRQHDIRNREFIGENPRTREVQILDWR